MLRVMLTVLQGGDCDAKSSGDWSSPLLDPLYHEMHLKVCDGGNEQGPP
jgi:hypothetical protein